MDQQEKEIRNEWKSWLKQSLKKNSTRLWTLMIRSIGWMIGIHVVLIVLLFVFIIVDGLYFKNVQALQIAISVFKVLGYGNIILNTILFCYRYWKAWSTLINTALLKFFLQKWTMEQDGKLDELSQKYKDDKNASSAIREFKSWMDEEVKSVMAIE